MRVYVAGNLLVEKDSLPIKLIPYLKKAFPNIDFVEYDPSEDLPIEKEIVFIDTIEADEIMVIEDLNKIKLDKIYSLHDFDLGYTLKLMKKFGMVEKVKIIGLPSNTKIDVAVEKIRECLKSN